MTVIYRITDPGCSVSEKMEAILNSVGLRHLVEKFERDKVGIDDASLLSDHNLQQLGVVTIGDRVRLREALRQPQLSIYL